MTAQFDANSSMMRSSCGRPIYSNTIINNTTATSGSDPTDTTKTASRTCPNSSSIPCPLPLRLNPRIIGTLIDETGSIDAGSVIWSDEAWCKLLHGYTAEKLVGARDEELRRVEEAMMWKRISILFGWSSSVGRLVGLRAWEH